MLHKKNLLFPPKILLGLGLVLLLGATGPVWAVNGFINYSNAIARNLLDDELWGGVTIGYSW